jgi:hypothetical protein
MVTRRIKAVKEAHLFRPSCACFNRPQRPCCCSRSLGGEVGKDARSAPRESLDFLQVGPRIWVPWGRLKSTSDNPPQLPKIVKDFACCLISACSGRGQATASPWEIAEALAPPMPHVGPARSGSGLDDRLARSTRGPRGLSRLLSHHSVQSANRAKCKGQVRDTAFLTSRTSLAQLRDDGACPGKLLFIKRRA